MSWARREAVPNDADRLPGDPGAALARVAALLPPAVAWPGEDELEALPLDAAPPPGVAMTSPLGAGSWLVRHRGCTAQVTLQTQRQGPAAEGVLVFLGRLAGKVVVEGIRSGGFLAVGQSPLANLRVGLGEDAVVTIGDGTTASSLAVNAARSHVSIGRDCLASGDVTVMASRHHGIVDLAGGAPRIDDRPLRLEVGDHVWLDHRSLVVGPARVGAGSIVGPGAVVSGDVEPRVAVAGNPARVVRRDVTWSRSPDRVDTGALAFLSSN